MGSTGSEEPEYRIIRMPLHTPDVVDFTDYAAKFQTTKLAALKQSPTEWIYQYEAEVIHPLPLWEQRLKRSNTVHACIVVSDPTVSDTDALLHGEWAGFAVIRGPLTYESYYATPEMQQPIPEHPEDETRWHFYDLYTFPAHRGRGVARKLIHASLDAAKESTRVLKEKDVRTARVRLICNPKNSALVDTYARMGFAKCGKCTLREVLEVNGMAESVPARSKLGEEEFVNRFESRIGVMMDQTFDVVYDN